MEWISVASLVAIPLILAVAWLRGWSMLLATTVAMAALFATGLITGFDRLTIFGSPLLTDLAWRPEYLDPGAWMHWYTVLTTMFLHSDPLHLLMNLVIYIIMGLGLEDRLGRGRFLAVFIVSGIIGTLLHSLVYLGSSTPVVGASGAVFGVMGAYASLYPRDRVFFFFILIIPNVPVYIAATVYTVAELVYFVMAPTPGVAHHAHIGGLLGGVFFALLLAKVSDLPGLEHRRVRRRKAGPRGPSGTPGQAAQGGTTHPPLSDLLDTEEQVQLYRRLQENRDEPELASAWLERLAAKTRCPRCGATLSVHGTGLRCTCGYRAES